MSTINWQSIITAVYAGNQAAIHQKIQDLVPFANATAAAQILGDTVARQAILPEAKRAAIPETIRFIMRMTGINSGEFASWIFYDSLKPGNVLAGYRELFIREVPAKIQVKYQSIMDGIIAQDEQARLLKQK